MRITDLLESQNFDESDFISEKGELDYDLVEDLSYFMNHDDDTYRRHVYPNIVKCLHSLEKKKDTNPSIFKNSVVESYKQYIKQFPIRQLSDELDDKTLNNVCKKFYEDLVKHVDEGKYKD